MPRAVPPLTARGLTVWLVLLVALLAVTNRYADWTADAPLVQYAASDGNSYRAIAQAFPGLPADGAGLVHHHAQRFPVAWAVGAVADRLGIGVDAAFRLVVIAALLLTLWITGRALGAIGTRPTDRLLLLALLVLAPLSTRFYLAFPWIVPDTVFLAGAALVAWGLSSDRLRWLVAGVLIAAAARQTALLLIPGLMLWAAQAGAAAEARGGAAAGRGGGRRRQRVLVVGALAVAVVATYVVTDRLSEPFSAASMNADTVTGLVHWLADSPSLGGLASFLSRGVLVLLLPAVLLLWLWRGAPPQARRRALPLLVTAALIALQPVLGGPGVTGNNLARLVLLGAPLIVVALGLLAAAQPERLPAWRPRELGLILAVLAAGSMHHITSLVGRDDSAWAPAFAVLTLACDAAIVAVMWWATRRSAGETARPTAPAARS